jgi:PRTRC genetic system protein E
MTEHTPTPGLFSQLLPLLAQRAILITISTLEHCDQLQVNICPRLLKEGENPALTTPLSVCGTAAELDLELVPQVAAFVAAQVRLHSNLSAIQKELAAVERMARDEASKKYKAVSNGARRPEAQPLNLFDTPNQEGA